LATQYTKIKNLTDTTNERLEDIEIENHNIKVENSKLKQDNKNLKNYINKSIEWIAIILDWSMDRVHKMINSFVERKEDIKDERKHKLKSNKR